MFNWLRKGTLIFLILQEEVFIDKKLELFCEKFSQQTQVSLKNFLSVQ
jgi:hypothetical protein